MVLNSHCEHTLMAFADPTRLIIQTGDLIFVRPQLDPRQAVDDAILAVGNATIQWMRAHGFQVPTNETSVHVALAWRNGSSLIFVEATPPAVRLTRATDFWKAWSGAKAFYHAIVPTDKIPRHVQERAVEHAVQQVGTPYSYGFSPPPSAFYCSSLVEWSYQRAVSTSHVFINQSFPLIFVPRDFWERYYAKMGVKLPPPNTTGSNPTLLLHSPLVRFHRLSIGR